MLGSCLTSTVLTQEGSTCIRVSGKERWDSVLRKRPGREEGCRNWGELTGCIAKDPGTGILLLGPRSCLLLTDNGRCSLSLEEVSGHLHVNLSGYNLVLMPGQLQRGWET